MTSSTLLELHWILFYKKIMDLVFSFIRNNNNFCIIFSTAVLILDPSAAVVYSLRSHVTLNNGFVKKSALV